ncbi:MAG: Spo0E family sporulation regulatory protein-aspartic acid phosphatase [Clostridiales bacterium]|nr:Spo0E family sporulation regulatory protein-aspartic acid phosphatase [Clostridiales bacterium]
MIYRDIEKKIKRKQKKLDRFVSKYGLNSEKTLKISRDLDNIINEYLYYCDNN